MITTSITLPDTLLADIDKICGGAKHRSAFIESAIRSKLEPIIQAKDLEILNTKAVELNHEANEVLDWQIKL